MRDIATAAGVSSSLVVHHYRTKANLRAAADRRAVEVFTELIDEFSGAALDELDDAGELFGTSLTAAFEARFGGDSPMVGYVRRLLIDGGPAAETLFDTLLGAVRGMLDDLTAHGIVSPSEDPAVRAALLLVNDLALMLLREQLTHALGVDPLGRSGMQRWAGTMMTVYRDGLFVSPETRKPLEAPGKQVDDDRTGD